MKVVVMVLMMASAMVYSRVVMVAKGCGVWRGGGVEELHVGGDDKNGGVAWRWSGGCRRMMAVVWWRGCGSGGRRPRWW
ncbi:hypothetical protein Tco_0727499 [Tanacetum coccineum]|uniref:Secreted protein n=1 Tax=Tanacetum coccineum TaxID=301880 RepID=A0ABQ4YLJ9_9ASTR